MGFGGRFEFPYLNRPKTHMQCDRGVNFPIVASRIGTVTKTN